MVPSVHLERAKVFGGYGRVLNLRHINDGSQIQQLNCRALSGGYIVCGVGAHVIIGVQGP